MTNNKESVIDYKFGGGKLQRSCFVHYQIAGEVGCCDILIRYANYCATKGILRVSVSDNHIEIHEKTYFIIMKKVKISSGLRS